jgi:Stage II sporulation protein E (SpoIIE)
MTIRRSSGARTAAITALLACLCVALFAAAYADARFVHRSVALLYGKAVPQGGLVPAVPALLPLGKLQPDQGIPQQGGVPDVSQGHPSRADLARERGAHDAGSQGLSPNEAARGDVARVGGAQGQSLPHHAQPGNALRGGIPHGTGARRVGLPGSGSSGKGVQGKGLVSTQALGKGVPSVSPLEIAKDRISKSRKPSPHSKPPSAKPDKAPEKSALRSTLAAAVPSTPASDATSASATPASAAPAASAVALPTTVPTAPSKPSLAGRGAIVRRQRTIGRHRRPGARHAATTGPLPTGAPTKFLAAAAATPTTPPSGSADPKRASHPRSHTRTHASSNPLSGIGKHIPLPIPVPDWSKPIIIALLVLAAWFAVRWAIVALRARRLERQRAALLHDLGAMQAALVPMVPPRLGGLAVSVAYRPAAGPAAGGDFYDLFVLEAGKVAIMLGDVAGHGDEALTHAALTRYTLRAYLQAGLEPRAALALAGRVLTDPAGERYATVAVGVFDMRSGRLTYALAGHPPPIVRAPHAPEAVTSCSSPAIGWGLPTGRRQTVVSLPAGAEVCFFSDGLMEARADGTLLGRERLQGILAALGSRRQAPDLLEGVRAAAEATPDDMVACIISPEKTAGGKPVHVEELETDAPALTAGHVERFLTDCQVSRAEIGRALALAHEIAAVRDTVLLRVERMAGGTPTVTVAATGPRKTRAGAAARAQDPPVDPLLQALATG